MAAHGAHPIYNHRDAGAQPAFDVPESRTLYNLSGETEIASALHQVATGRTGHFTRSARFRRFSFRNGLSKVGANNLQARGTAHRPRLAEMRCIQGKNYRAPTDASFLGLLRLASHATRP
jgi:hypothetical protein